MELLKAGAVRLRDLALGDPDERALHRCYESGFRSMLENIAQGLDSDRQALVEDVLRSFVAVPEVARALLGVALAGAETPDLPALRAAFDALEFDRATLPVDFDRAMSAYYLGLTAALLKEAGLPDSALFGRFILERVQTVHALLQEQRHTLDEVLDAVHHLKPDLPLAWPVQTPPDEVPELRAELLQPKYRLVPFTGRAFRDNLQNLLGWARGLNDAQPPVGLRTYVGPGGAGKTRLLIEAGEALRGEGWRSDFLLPGRLTRDNAAPLCADARPTMLIADYVANRAQEVRDLLHAAARAAPQRASPLAIVLLERGFPRWLEVDLHTPTDPEYVNWPAFVALSTVEQEPRVLPDLNGVERPMLFEAALDRFGNLLPSANLRAAPRYGELPEAPLYVILLALLAVSGVRVERPADPSRILEYVWGREREAWKRHLRPLFVNQPEARLDRAVGMVEDLAVLATLGRAFPDLAALEAFLEERYRSMPGVGWDEMVDTIPDLFPRAEGGVVPPIAPDPLADWILLERLSTKPQLLDWVVTSDRPEQLSQAMLVLARLQKEAPGQSWINDLMKRLRSTSSPNVLLEAYYHLRQTYPIYARSWRVILEG